MRYFVLTTLTFFSIGIFGAGVAIAAGEPKSSEESTVQSQQSGQEMGQQQLESQDPKLTQDIGTASGQKQELAGQQLSSRDVLEIQQALQEEGIDPGPIDGIMGPKTEAAIQQFQQQEGIAASGQLNQETAEALNVQLEGQEFMGVSPAFGEQERKQEQQDKSMQQQDKSMQQQEEKSPEKRQY